MIHVRIGPGVDRSFDDFLEIAVVVEVEAHAADDESQEKEHEHDEAGGFVPEDQGDKIGERHKAGVDDREPRDRVIADGIDVFRANIDHQADECAGEEED